MSLSPPAACGRVSTVVPEPVTGSLGLRDFFAGLLRRRDLRWGGQLLRVASDPILICDGTLTIRHHNRAFLKAVGFRAGHFRGFNLAEFFPGEERDGIADLFASWKLGHAAGMRFQANLVTIRGLQAFDFRAVRSRDRFGDFNYYLVARDAVKRPGGIRESETDEDPIFRGLPVAAWRTDGNLRITQVFGSLWPELGVAGADLVGELFGKRHDSLLPGMLQEIDCSDTLSGMSLNCEIEREGERFNVSVEPFFNGDGGLVGTVGMLRRCVDADRSMQAESPLRARHHLPPVEVPDPRMRTRVISRQPAP